MRTVVLYSSGHLGSAAILSEMARWPSLQIVGLVRADTVSISTDAGYAKACRQFRKLGNRFAWLLVWQRVIQAVGYGLGRCMPWRRRVRAGREIAAELGVPTLSTVDINAAGARAWLADRAPDLLVSACFSQMTT